MGLKNHVVAPDTTEEELNAVMADFQKELDAGRQVAFVIRKNALEIDEKEHYANEYTLNREAVVEMIASVSGSDVIVSTTGKISRELFEIRERSGQGHQYDFLTVGSMGHASSIALGIALQKSDRRIWCIEGDGAVLMHMGAMAVVGANHPDNLIHILINNGAHETVGGMPTVAAEADLTAAAKACGYQNAVCVRTMEELKTALETARESHQLSWIEVKTGIGSRKDLGRPTTTPVENKQSLMRYLAEGK
jgi:phosphonopyruvate decarboxylase